MKQAVFANSYRELGPRTLQKAAAFAVALISTLTLILGTMNDIWDIVYQIDQSNNQLVDFNYGTVALNRTQATLDKLAMNVNYGTKASNRSYDLQDTMSKRLNSMNTNIASIDSHTRNIDSDTNKILDLVKRQVDLTAVIEGNIATMTTIQGLMHTQNTNTYKMLTEKLTRIITLLEETTTLEHLRRRMNEAVNGIKFQTLITLDFTGDMCEYDPFGIGPIECEGSEQLKGSIDEIEFRLW